MLSQRIATAAVGIPLIILLVLAGGRWYVAAVAAALAVATLEFQQVRHGWRHPLSWLAAAFVTAMAGGAHVGYNWVLWFATSAVLVTLVAVLFDFDAERALDDWLWMIGGIMYVGLLGVSLVLLRDFSPNGRDWVFVTLLGTFATDTGAFFIGRQFGTRKLAPKISPKKTVQGLWGGLACGFAAVLLLNYLLGLRIPPGQAIALGAIIPVAAVLGDLAESAMKRSMHIKDTSELIPGHGGVLDRLDSVLFTFTAAYLFTQWVVL